MFRLSSAIFREVLKYKTDYFYKIIIILSLLNTKEYIPPPPSVSMSQTRRKIK